MGVIEMRFMAKSLSLATSAQVILPMPRHADVPVQPLPVLYLLHGMGDDDTAWLYKTGIERYATQAGLAVVMPDGELSCYENMAHGCAYRDFILDELPQVMGNCFPLSSKPEENFIAGCSMGGFGALKLGLAAPEKFAAIGCFSAAHMEYRPDSYRNRQMLRLSYGEKLAEIEAQIEKDALRAAKLPLSVWHACGDADILKENALKTRAFMETIPGLDYHFEMLPGRHDWGLWDEMARRFIESLKLPKPEVALL